MKQWKVGVVYEHYGYITVETEDDASTEDIITAAQEILETMTETDLAAITEPLPDSQHVDTEFVEEIHRKEK